MFERSPREDGHRVGTAFVGFARDAANGGISGGGKARPARTRTSRAEIYGHAAY